MVSVVEGKVVAGLDDLLRGFQAMLAPKAVRKGQH